MLLNYRAAGLRGLLPGGPALVLATAVKLSFLVNGLLTLPMYLFPGKRGRWGVATGLVHPPLSSQLFTRCFDRLVQEHSAQPPALLPSRPAAQSNLWAALPSQSAEQRMGRTSSFAATNIASLAACALVAMLVPSIWKPLKLLGGTAVSCLAFVFPGAIALSMYSARGGGGPSGRGNWDRALWALGWVLVAVGWVQLAASVASQFT